MKQQLLLLTILLLAVGIARAELRTEKLAELDTQLQLLLPGTSNHEQANRAFAKEQIQDLLQGLEDRRIRRKNTDKALQLLEEEVSFRFLRKPGAFTNFHQLFTTGQYDRSTASALYALAMEYFDLPYTLTVRDAEILITASAEGTSHEFTLPHGDPWTAASSQRFQNAYLEVLRSIGYLSPAEWRRSPKALYDQYYIGGETEVDLQQMASFLFCRQALKAYYDEAWSNALDWIYKAELLQRWPVQKVLRRAVWLQLANQKDNPEESLRHLWMIWQESPGAPWQRELLRHFNQAISKQANQSIWQIDSTYLSFQEQFARHPGAQGQLRELYYLHRARFHARENNTGLVMSFMDSLYNLHPQNVEVQDVLAGMLVWTLRAVREFGDGLTLINKYERQYPFLANHILFQDRNLFYQAERIRYHFNADEAVLGNQYLKEFQARSNRGSRPPGYVSWLSTAHLSASDYYFRKKNYQQAFMLVEEARQQAPEDPYLDHRVDVLRRYLR
ncbi:MAG: hypothetical protein AAFP77_05835 [Bacteroidota bacterium]